MPPFPYELIPQILCYLPISSLRTLSLLPLFLVPAQRLIFSSINITSLYECSSLASLLRDTKSSHLSSYVRRLHISLRETAAVMATGGRGWLDDAQDLLVELLGMPKELEELDVNYWASRGYGSLRWESRLTQNLQDAIARVLALPSLNSFRIHRASFQNGFVLDKLLRNMAGKKIKRINLDKVTLWNNEGLDAISFSPSSFPQACIEMEELYLNINRHPSTLPWLLHPKCPIQYSTIQRLRLAQFMHYEDKVAELLAKSSVSVGAVELILYDYIKGPELPYTPLSFYAPSVLHTLILHLPFLASEGMNALDWIKSTLSTIPSSNVIQNVTLNMHAANDDAEFGITTQQETKARWVEFGDYLFEPARFPKLKKVDVAVLWMNYVYEVSDTEDRISEKSKEAAEDYSRTLAGYLTVDSAREKVVSVHVRYDLPEVWVEHWSAPRR